MGKRLLIKVSSLVPASLSLSTVMLRETLPSLKPELQEGYRAVSGNRLADAKAAFKSVLLGLLLVPITSDAEATEV